MKIGETVTKAGLTLKVIEEIAPAPNWRPKPMASEREQRIREFRLRQPIEELERKARKAAHRFYWGPEELDAAEVRAKQLAAIFAEHKPKDTPHD